MDSLKREPVRVGIILAVMAAIPLGVTLWFGIAVWKVIAGLVGLVVILRAAGPGFTNGLFWPFGTLNRVNGRMDEIAARYTVARHEPRHGETPLERYRRTKREQRR